MMIYLVLLGHLSLMAANYRLSRSLLYPPAAFTCLWSILLLLLILSGDFFYPISDFTLILFMLGSVAFSAGGLLALIAKCETYLQSRSASRQTAMLLDIALIALILMFPMYIGKLHELSALSGVDDFWMGIRTQTSTGVKENVDFGAFSYLLSFSNFVSLAALSESIRSSYSKRKTLLILAITFAYGFSTAARTGTITLLLSLVCVLLLHGKFKIKTALIVAVSFFILFAAPAVLLGKGGAKDAGIAENLTSLIENLQVYALAGMVAFDQTVLRPGVIESNNSTFMFFAALLKALGRSFGFQLQTAPTVLDYTATPWLTNVYSVYFPYYSDFGLWGLMAIMFSLGAVLSFFYRFAVTGRPEFILLYSLSFGFLMITSFAEAFLTALSYWIQATIFAFVLYNAPSFSFSRNTARLKHPF
jgi:oligosaccharide repeat unit polymerase